MYLREMYLHVKMYLRKLILLSGWYRDDEDGGITEFNTSDPCNN